MRRLAAQPNVDYVVHDRIVTASHLRTQPIPHPTFSVVVAAQSPYDTFYTTSPQGWAVRQVGGYGNNVPGGPANGPWNTTMGKGVRIAIIDSGVDATHPDIAPNLALNLSEVDQSELPSSCDDGTPQDQQGHGTWTASLAAAALGPGTGQLIGVAPAATLLNIKVLERMPAAIAGDGSTLAAQCTAGEATGLLSWVIQGIDDAVTNHADVISLSLGTIVDLTTGEGAGLKAAFDQRHLRRHPGRSRPHRRSRQRRPTISPTRATSKFPPNPAASSPSSPPPTLPVPKTSPPVPPAPPAPSPSPTTATTEPLSTPSPHPAAAIPQATDLAISGWVRGACSSGKPSTTDGPPTDAAHSYGCFNLGHTPYVQAIGTSASAPLAAGVAALLRAAHPTWDADHIIDVMRSTAIPSPQLPVPQVDAAAALAQP